MAYKFAVFAKGR